MTVDLQTLTQRVGLRVRHLREVRGLSQVEACRRAKLSVQTWSRLERGASQNHTLDTFAAVAGALEVDFGALFVDVEPPRGSSTLDNLVAILVALDEPARAGLLLALHRISDVAPLVGKAEPALAR